MKLKGLEPIEKILNDFLEPFDCIAKMGLDFAYNFITEEITYSLVEIGAASEAFLLDAESRFPQVHAPLFIWSFLHELGHRITDDDLESEEIFESEMIKAHEAKENELFYFIAPDEYAATEWAGNYMIEHEREVAELWRELAPAIRNFYIVNNVIED